MILVEDGECVPGLSGQMLELMLLNYLDRVWNEDVRIILLAASNIQS